MKKISKKIILYFFLMIVGLLMVGPFLWLFFSSVLPGTNVYDFPNNLRIENLGLKNYSEVMEFMDFGKYILNTVIITLICVMCNAFLSSLTAYPLAKMKFKGKGLIFNAIVATMIIPAAAGMIVNYITITNLGLVNSFIGVILPSAVSVFNIFLMRQGFLSIPDSIRESGKMDGASEMTIFLKLIMPMMKPTLAVVVLFQFMANWNDFLWPMIVLNDTDKYPLAAALTLLNGQFSYNFGWIAAGTVISVIPIIIVFIFTQKYFVEGVSGATKG
ncbi:carbohydrate ABC transporter permease [Enterococcus diestrammenae]|uniref:carbohydrate ABC transporter permease n=1 Tax=Enterococcus diestrammenae TaxID=1155073 RepID=UPI00195A8130